MVVAKVRDFTEAPQPALRLEVDPSPAYELLFELFALGNRDDADELAVGPDWFAQRLAALPEAVKEGLEKLATSGEIWLTLVGIAYETPAPKTVAAFLDRVAGTDPEALRTTMFTHAGFTKHELDSDVVQRALAGDAGSFAQLCDVAGECHDGPGWAHLLAMDPSEGKELVLTVLRGYADTVFDEGVGEILDRDARSKRSLAATMPIEALVERATNGVGFTYQPGMEGVVLVPSVVSRPLVLILQHKGLRMFGYPVSEEFFEGDPSTPPGWLVDLYKALGDAKRLRLLTMLSERDYSLAELVDRMGLSKSTVHHHLRLLRAARLVRVTLGEESVYSLRREGLAQAGPLLETYLSSMEG